MSIPLKALYGRLQTAVETPSWACYLPKGTISRDSSVSNYGLTSRRSTADAAFEDRPVSRDKACAVGTQQQQMRSPKFVTVPTARSDALGVMDGCGPTDATPLRDSNRKLRVHTGLPPGYNVWKRARDPRGCREVQAALANAPTDEARLAIASELRGRVWEAIQCPHANHVVQKCIVTLQPEAAQFIVDELLARGPDAAGQAARHRYGCRILERLLEQCFPQQVTQIVEGVISDAVSLSAHPYGNYVVQHLLEHGSDDQRKRLAEILRQHALALGSDSFAAAVLTKALTHGSLDPRLALARTAVQTPGLLAAMARTRHGHVAVKLVLQLLAGVPSEHAAACRELQADVSSLRSSRYGRAVANSLEGQNPSILKLEK